VLSLHGTLTLDNVASTWRESQSLLHEGIQTVDLSDVTRVDSAGLALLLEWQARAHKRHKALRIVNAPDDLIRLADLSEAKDLLGLNGRSVKG
ncbi:MAG: STAS domain-containing protein, partial [Gammaproteobacteria bacterium]|nr:STAS domain-containing protein [Gammaproteobacteria bacterium]